MKKRKLQYRTGGVSYDGMLKAMDAAGNKGTIEVLNEEGAVLAIFEPLVAPSTNLKKRRRA